MPAGELEELPEFAAPENRVFSGGETDGMKNEPTFRTLIQDDVLQEAPAAPLALVTRTNGEEDCGVTAPWGVHCTLGAYHPAFHSWQTPEGKFDGAPEVIDAEQTTLDAGIDVPFETTFNGKDYMLSENIAAIARRLIEGEDEFEHLVGVKVGYYWKRRGGTSGGNPRFAGIKRPTGLELFHLGGDVTYELWLAADHLREAKLTARQVEALIFSYLCRTETDPEDHSAYRLRGPDFVGFKIELERYGLWSTGLAEAARGLQQMTIDDVAPAEVQSVEEHDADESDEQ
jgi:hypothetical protein